MEAQSSGALERVEAGRQGGLEVMSRRGFEAWRYGGCGGIDVRYGGLEGVSVWRFGGLDGVQALQAARPGGEAAWNEIASSAGGASPGGGRKL
jgi:hypothetical protein